MVFCYHNLIPRIEDKLQEEIRVFQTARGSNLFHILINDDELRKGIYACLIRLNFIKSCRVRLIILSLPRTVYLDRELILLSFAIPV